MDLTIEAKGKTITAPVDSHRAALLIARAMMAHGADRAVISGAEPSGPYGAVSKAPEAGAAHGWVFPAPYEESGDVGAWTPIGEANDTQLAAWMAGAAPEEDLVSAMRTADDWIDREIFGSKEGAQLIQAVPYGDLITAAHRLRREAQGSPVATPPGPTPAPGDAAAEVLRRQTADRLRASLDAATLAIIVEAQAVTRAARKGDPNALRRIRDLKDQAAGGDASARRRWKVYTLVADEDQRLIDEGARVSP